MTLKYSQLVAADSGVEYESWLGESNGNNRLLPLFHTTRSHWLEQLRLTIFPLYFNAKANSHFGAIHIEFQNFPASLTAGDQNTQLSFQPT